MRKILPSLHILSMPIATGVIACTSSAADDRPLPPPSSEQVIATVFANQDTVFPPQQACADTAAATIGDHLLSSLVYAINEQAINIDTSCTHGRVTEDLIDFYSNERIYPDTASETLKTFDTGQSIYTCRLTVSHDLGESAWSRTIQMLLHGNKHTPVPGTFRCMSLP